MPTPSDSLYLLVQNNSTEQLSISSSLPTTSADPLLNGTASHKKGGGEEYQIPDTSITLYINLGFACNETALQNSIIASRDYCQQQMKSGAKSELPPSKDSFDYGYGIRIIIVSVRPHHRLTWAVSESVLGGMWNYLVEDGRYMEASFDIVDTGHGILGRGEVESALPWLSTSQKN